MDRKKETVMRAHVKKYMNNENIYIIFLQKLL